MPTYADLHMPPPKSWDEFEDITCSAAKNRWGNPNFTRHGRQGQRQDGVDIYGNDHQNRLVGLQCKNTLSAPSQKIIEDEIRKAENFQRQLKILYIATTANSDQPIQEFVRAISEAREQQGDFGVGVLFWSDIWQDLTRDETRLFQHYPQLRPQNDFLDHKPGHDRKLFEEFQSVFPYEPAMRLLRDHDFGGPFLKQAIQPLYDFVETWDQPEKEFLDLELQTALSTLYENASNMAQHLVGKTVPIGNGGYISVYSDRQRAEGPRPESVIEDARVLNKEAQLFVAVYDQFFRLCRQKLMR